MTLLASAEKFDRGAPRLTTPALYGGSPDKPFLFSLNATGERPLRFSAEGLPRGLALDADTGVISGTPAEAGDALVRLTARNAMGEDQKSCVLRIAPDGALLTPLLGWCSWNACGGIVTQKDIERAADLMVSTGLSAYGYRYINVDSGWQGAYGGEPPRILPNAKFPDMKGLCDHVHANGLKIGIYSTPMQLAWGGGLLPGCTRGRMDSRFPNAFYGIGTDHREAENVAQWAEWGIDYLKYDWDPCDIENAEKMKACLRAAPRDMPFCVTVHAGIAHADYWKVNCCSWRDNSDSRDNWENIVANRFSTDHWAQHISAGHYFDMDMMETGYIVDHKTNIPHPCNLTHAEQMTAYTIRVIFPSPIQLSCDLGRLSDFDLSLLCNPEVIAIHQDPLGVGAICASSRIERSLDGRETAHTRVYLRPLADGSLAAAFFNLSPDERRITLPLSKRYAVRDLWLQRDMGAHQDTLQADVPAHGAALFRLTEPDADA